MQIFDYLNKEGLLHLIRKIMGRDVDLTQAEYDALPESKNSDGKNYYIYDSDIAVTAEEVGFDGSASGSTAANSQQALDELFAADKKTNESLEKINSNLSDVVTIITATLNSLTVAANGNGNMSQDISSFIPNGYKCIGACFVSSGSSWFIPVGVYLIGTSVQVYVRNTYTGQDQGAPIINLICIRN